MKNELDHIMIGARTLDEGVQYISDTFGAEAVYGGRHDSGGTCNALLGFEEPVYLEVIAPDPESDDKSPFRPVLEATLTPQIYTFIVRTDDFDGIEAAATELGLKTIGPQKLSRALPDGTVLEWSLLFVSGHEFNGLMPFFINWDATPNPRQTLDPALSLRDFSITTPNAAKLQRYFSALGVPVPVKEGEAQSFSLICGQGGSETSMSTPPVKSMF